MSDASTTKSGGFPNPLAWLGRGTLGLFAEIGRLSMFAGRVGLAALTPPWNLAQLWKQIIAIGFYSLPVVGLSAVFIGAALALNIYTGGNRFGAEQFVPNIVVLGITRELGATITGLMLAGRVTAGIAAEIGAMKVTRTKIKSGAISISARSFCCLSGARQQDRREGKDHAEHARQSILRLVI